MPPPRNNTGFTLIELSIVLAIIALVTGAILAGRDLLAHAELRKLITQHEQFKIASKGFIAKYNCMPGDCRNAYDFFNPACGDDTDDGTVGCNGDGNGLVVEIPDSTMIGEHLKFWRHLSLAGIIQTPYLGVPAITLDGPEARPGVNVPLASLQRSTGDHPLGWNAMLCLYVASTPSNIDPVATNGFCLSGSRPPVENHAFWYPLLTHEEAYFIDSKADDGFPTSGKILGDISYGYGGSYGCAGTDYFNAPPSTQNCSLSFIW